MSRYRLNWYELEELENGDYSISFPVGNIYSELVDQAFPKIEKTGWRSSGSTVFCTNIKSPNVHEVEHLRNFLDLLKEILVLRLNKHLEDHFEDELDQCFALDYNFKSIDDEGREYTDTGKLEYEAKYNRDHNSIYNLAKFLADVCQRHPVLQQVGYIAAVPGNPEKDVHLPDLLVEKMGKILGRDTGLALRKTEETPQLKNLSVEDKISTIEDVFCLEEDIEGKSILLIDDLYQSGTTMWTLARFLKENGADSVYGLACVKSWRDSDNI